MGGGEGCSEADIHHWPDLYYSQISGCPWPVAGPTPQESAPYKNSWKAHLCAPLDEGRGVPASPADPRHRKLTLAHHRRSLGCTHPPLPRRREPTCSWRFPLSPGTARGIWAPGSLVQSSPSTATQSCPPAVPLAESPGAEQAWESQAMRDRSGQPLQLLGPDRKSTRLNSSH